MTTSTLPQLGTIVKEQLFRHTADGPIAVKRHALVMRGGTYDGLILHPAVSENYTPVRRPMELIEQITKVLQDNAPQGVTPYCRWGISKDNTIWASWRVGMGVPIAGESFNVNILMRETPLGGYKLSVVLERVICLNGSIVADKDCNIELFHSSAFEERLTAAHTMMNQRLKHAMTVAENSINRLRSISIPDSLACSAMLLRVSPSLKTFERAFLELNTEDRTENKRFTDLSNAYYYGRGANPGNLWGLASALTYQRDFNAYNSGNARRQLLDARLLHQVEGARLTWSPSLN